MKLRMCPCGVSVTGPTSTKYCSDKCRKAVRLQQARNQARLYRQRYPEKLKDRKRERYGLVPGEYVQMLVAQEGRCTICSRSFGPDRKDWPHVDHNHERPGTHRDILCPDCNQGLGKFLDSPDLLRAAALYLESYL